ncbi:PH-like domain-containing protein [Amycolatopsis sp. H20-H5]|uniref:PH-like domain-containing protein n=1 Tax=Amycolatopsis sp. H20-H5 TaxID=3046309 RepID=UPI002DBBF100|nr:transporter [Amycolatopsis sp. H20-H5]MEC3980996.1 transporter [Amycolatopsis sp. H20-H5]
MERLLLVLAIVVFFLLCLVAMRRGWKRKARVQSVRVPLFPEIPADLGEPLLADSGLYISTTSAGDWQDRIVTRGAGIRTKASWRLHESGVAIERAGGPDFFIPAEDITGARASGQIAGKVMGNEGLLIITWLAGQVPLDTGFRGDLDVYPQWIERLAPQDQTIDPELKGGAQ